MEKFIKQLQEEVFADTEISKISPDTIFKDIDEWDSLAALLLIAFFDSHLGKKISSEQIKSANTIMDLFNLANK